MHYKVICSGKVEDLVERVAESLKGGWKCQGGVSVTCDDGSDYFYQAMIKE